MRLLRLILLLILLPLAAGAEVLRVATFAAPLTRSGPGLLLRDILSGRDAQIAAIIAQITAVAPDILVLTAFDHDADLVALSAFAAALEEAGGDYPHYFSLLPNSGMATGLDMNGDGRRGDARDAQGYGRFAGHGGLAVLSRWPIDRENVVDFSTLLWRDLPGAVLPVTPDGGPFPSKAAQAIQRLSSTGHWVVPVLAPGGPVDLMIWSATPPVFDGEEDMNGLRSADEARFWQRFLDGDLDFYSPARAGAHFVLLGNANLDPFDGDGDRATIAALLADPRLIDPQPASEGGRFAADTDQTGPPEQDTASWASTGNLRVSYVLPSANWEVLESGVFWPPPGDSLAALFGEDGLAAGPHRLVWAELHRQHRHRHLRQIGRLEIRQKLRESVARQRMGQIKKVAHFDQLPRSARPTVTPSREKAGYEWCPSCPSTRDQRSLVKKLWPGKALSAQASRLSRLRAIRPSRKDSEIVEPPVDLGIPPLPVWFTAHAVLRPLPRIARVWDHLVRELAVLMG